MIEYRNIKSAVELRAEDGNTISGYAVRFNEQSQDLGFFENIDPGALSNDVILASDVFALYNHNNDNFLARSRYGKGSLKLELRSDGLYYEFEVPNTSFGQDVKEKIKRGECEGSSFAFTVAEDAWTKGADGKIHRNILKIDRLFDVSICPEPAYLSTSVSCRNKPSDYELQIRSLDEDMNENDEKIKALEEENKALREQLEAQKEEEKPADEPKEEPKEEKSCGEDEPKEEKAAPEETKEEEKPAQEEKEPAENENRNNDQKINKSNIRKMEKKYSLVKEIRNAMDSGKSIIIPATSEERAYTVNDEGENVVQTDLYSILEPLRAKNVCAAAGCKFLTGLVGDVEVPRLSANEVKWKGETSAAEDGSGNIDNVKLSPARLTGKFPVSLQFIQQDSVDAEAAIRRDIVNALNDKLEETIFSNTAATGDEPDGLAYILAADAVAVSDYGDICDLEADVEENNVYGELKYIVSPKFKAGTRSMIKATNATGCVFENNAIDGTPAISTAHVPSSYAFYGDWSNYAIGQWGPIQLDVCRDSVSLANGQVTILVNAFFDAKPLRNEAFACAYLA